MAEQTTINLVNGIDLDLLTKTVSAVKDEPKLGRSKFRITNKWIKGGHNRTTVGDFFTAGKEISHKEPYMLDADEPELLAGEDRGANPVEHLLGALAGCLTSSMVYHAALKGIEIEELEAHVEGDLDLRGFLDLSKDVRKGYENIRVTFKVKTGTENIEKLRELSEFSPVFDVVKNGTNVDIQVERI